jgi:hypothetical protein
MQRRLLAAGFRREANSSREHRIVFGVRDFQLRPRVRLFIDYCYALLHGEVSCSTGFLARVGFPVILSRIGGSMPFNY